MEIRVYTNVIKSFKYFCTIHVLDIIDVGGYFLTLHIYDARISNYVVFVFSYALNPTNQYLLRIWKTLQPYVVYTAPTIALIFYIENRDTNIHRHPCLKTSIFDGFNLSNSQIKWYCFNSMNTL